MVYTFFDKKTKGSGRPSSSASQIANNNENIQLADELHKPIIRKLKNEKRILPLEIIFGAQI